MDPHSFFVDPDPAVFQKISVLQNLVRIQGCRSRSRLEPGFLGGAGVVILPGSYSYSYYTGTEKHLFFTGTEGNPNFDFMLIF